jgi:hypothetical protein
MLTMPDGNKMSNFSTIGHGASVDYTIHIGSALKRTRDFLGAVNAVLNHGTSPSTYDPYAWLHPRNSNQSAALQLGIWESKYDTGTWSLSGGDFNATSLDPNTTTWTNAFFGAMGPGNTIDPRTS